MSPFCPVCGGVASGRPCVLALARVACQSFEIMLMAGGEKFHGKRRSRVICRAFALSVCRGSFAVVKEGRHKATGTAVAVKIVDKKDAVFDPESLEQEVCMSSVFVVACL